MIRTPGGTDAVEGWGGQTGDAGAATGGAAVRAGARSWLPSSGAGRAVRLVGQRSGP